MQIEELKKEIKEELNRRKGKWEKKGKWENSSYFTGRI